MHPKAPAHLGKGDDLLHKLRLLLFQFRELIYHKQEMGHCLRDRSLSVQSGVSVDMVHLRAAQQLLSSFIFTGNG